MSKQLVALMAYPNAMNLARLEAHRRSARKALQCLRVGEQGAVIPDLGEETGRDLFSSTWQ